MSKYYNDPEYREIKAIEKRFTLARKFRQKKVMEDLLDRFYELAYNQAIKLQTKIICLTKLEKILSKLPAKLKTREDITLMRESTQQTYQIYVEALDVLVLSQ